MESLQAEFIGEHCENYTTPAELMEIPCRKNPAFSTYTLGETRISEASFRYTILNLWKLEPVPSGSTKSNHFQSTDISSEQKCDHIEDIECVYLPSA